MFRSMADYTRPKPVDPIRYQPNGRLRIECGCGRIAVFKLSAFAEARQLDGSMRVHEMIARLRCATCGNRPKFAEVTKPTRGFVENYWGTGRAERALWPRARNH